MLHPRTVAIVLLVICQAGVVSTTADEPTEALLLGRTYPIETNLSFHFALLHWLDSLGGLRGPGMTAGKTIDAYRREYTARMGPPDARALEFLGTYAETRQEIVRRMGAEERNALNVAFLEAENLEQALRAAKSFLIEDELARLETALDHFAPAYRVIWENGATPVIFFDTARSEPGRKPLAGLLVDIAAFYGVELGRPYPSIVTVPVPWGAGTHAQAIDRHLLIEIRKGEKLPSQVSPVVHENAHFLFYRIPIERRQELERYATQLSPEGLEAWNLMHEALPTALGQGVAGQRFSEGWSTENPWYHREEVDGYAKRLYPLVRKTLRRKGRLDERFLDEAIPLYSPITLTSTRFARRPSNSP